MSPRSFQPNELTKAHQRAVLLGALKEGSVSTIAAREALGIGHPAGRVMELRRLGWPIVTARRTVNDAQGRPHTSAVYVLKSGGADHG